MSTIETKAATLARLKQIAADLNDTSPECLSTLDAIKIIELELELQQAQAALAAVTLEREEAKQQWEEHRSEIIAIQEELNTAEIVTDTTLEGVKQLRAQLAACQSALTEAKEHLDESERHNKYTTEESLRAAKTIAEMNGQDPTLYFASMKNRIWFLEMAKQLAACQSREATIREDRDHVLERLRQSILDAQELSTQFLACQSREAKALEVIRQLQDRCTELNGIRARVVDDRDQLQAQVGELRLALTQIFEWWDLADGHLTTHFPTPVCKKMEAFRPLLAQPAPATPLAAPPACGDCDPCLGGRPDQCALSAPVEPERKFIREGRYLVVKIKDAVKYLTESERDALERLHAKCQLGRIDEGKKQLRTVTVESDWPEYGPTWAAIEARMTGAPAAPDSAKDGARLDWLENGPCNRIEALPLNGVGPLYRWHLFDSMRKDPSQSCNSVRAAIDAAMAATPPKAAP